MTALTYLFDPLCGWCYGAAPALSALVAAGHAVTPLPSGLFAAPGRTMDAGFAAYAWAADQRIGRLTGQEFSPQYKANVLGRPHAPFDSSAATIALTAVTQSAPAREPEALEAIQRARYVEGRDVCDPAELAKILAALDLHDAARRAARPDPALFQAFVARVQAGRDLMDRLNINGVPALLLGTEHVLPNGLLYGSRPALLAAVAGL
jgi:putative protein-disulfide isomerase